MAKADKPLKFITGDDQHKAWLASWWYGHDYVMDDRDGTITHSWMGFNGDTHQFYNEEVDYFSWELPEEVQMSFDLLFIDNPFAT